MTKRFLFLAAALAPVLWFESPVYGHPMGNFSVSHYARFEPKPGEVDLLYVLDLAELPTFDLLRQWGLERSSPPGALQAKAAEQAREWARHLEIRFDGREVTPKLLSTSYVIADGAGNLPILRITSHLKLNANGGKLDYEDHNFEDRAGWKEIVIRAGSGATIERASQGGDDKSQALSAYPQDPMVAPPQDVRASFAWTAAGKALPVKQEKPSPVIAPIPQPKAPPMPAPVTMTPQAAPAGTVVKGDFLSRLLHQRELTMGMILIALFVAFGLGAAHALTPGHGKTIVAAYLVGSRGTLKHAALLGAMVTFTHTVSVFVLGLATLFLFQYVMPEKISQVLGVVSGLSIVAIGGWMLWKRARAVRPPAYVHIHDHHHHEHVHTHAQVHEHAHAHAAAHGHEHDHAHPHTHDHPHVHEHAHAHAAAHGHEHDHAHPHTHDHPHVHEHAHAHATAHGHEHDHAHPHTHDHPHVHEHAHAHAAAHGHEHDHAHPHTHDHPHSHPHPHTHDHEHVHTHTHSNGKLVHSHGPGGHVHSHDVPDDITWGSLIGLAVSGGLVPCESALVLLLSAIALGRVGLGLLLLIAFSLGLAIVLMAIGGLVIYAKNLLPERKGPRHPVMKWIPVASAAVVTAVGVVMTLVSLGWVQPKWMI